MTGLGALCALSRAGLIAIAVGAAPLAAPAQDAPALPAAAPPENLTDQVAAGPPLDAAEAETLSRALVFDPAQLSTSAPAARLRMPGVPQPRNLDVSGKDNADGGGTVTVKQPLPAEWDAKLGADLSVAPPPAVTYEPERPLPGSRNPPNSSGAAWASVGVLANLASVDARLNGGKDQGEIGTTVQHSVPFGSGFSVTLRDRFAVSETLAAPEAAPAGLPVMALPQAAAAPERVWSNQNDLRFNILPTGTTLAAAMASSSADPVTHNSLRAEQRVYGPLRVTTALNDIGQPTLSKSIAAAVKLTW